MSYVDGWVAAVPNENKEKYLEHAKRAAKVFKKHGALTYVENWGDQVPEGEVTSFPMAVKAKEGETVVFSRITWASRDVRNEGMQKAMEDLEFKMGMGDMPFDGKRLIFGGFETVLNE